MTKAELIRALMDSPHADTDPVEIAIYTNDFRWHSISHVDVWVDPDGTTPAGAPILLHVGNMTMG